MLPAALLTYRTQGDRIVPAFLGEADHPWLRALLEERERFVGRRRRELRARLQEPLPMAAPARKRALAAHVIESLAAAPAKPGTSPRRVRAALFAAARTAAVGAPRDAVVADVARRLGLSTDAVEALLFADLPDERLVAPLAEEASPVELATRANLALCRGLLARASMVAIELEGGALPVVRHAKLRGLIVTMADERGASAQLEISGPLSLFHHTRLYGQALGELLPLLAWSTRFRLEARCKVAEGPRRLVLASGDPISPANEPRRHDSRLEERFAKDLGRAAPEWTLIRDPRPVAAGASLVFPDFALRHREDPSRHWFLEIVGFWTPEYLQRKLEAYRAARLGALVLCIDAQRRCAEGELPAQARVVWFRRRIDARAVLAAIAAPSL